MPDIASPLRRLSARTLVLGGIGAAVALLVLVGGAWPMAWGDNLRRQEILLPGTTIAGVDVGEVTVQEASAAGQEQVAAALDRPVALTHGDRTWTTTPRALGATSDVEQVVAAALERTRRASLVELARVRFGVGDASAYDIALDVPDDAVASFVAEIARKVDTAPQDATLTWVDGAVRLDDAVTGLAVLQDVTAAGLERAIAEGATSLALAVEERAPAFGTDQARQVAAEVGGLLAAALDHEVTVTLADSTRRITPRGLGAEHNAPDLLRARAAAPEDVVVHVPEAAVDEVIEGLAAEHEVPSRNASLDWSPASGFAATPGSTGLAIDREAARDALHAALQGGTDRVDIELHTTTPRITTDSFQEVLLVRQADRRVDLYRGGAAVRSWPVAVGTSGYATPTGMFTIGAKRFEPTWHNSSPDGWGSDMPAKIGPGPDNPLGLRALNWEQNGHDTLIRFHGTANESSIGQAASHGCVRMLNADVIELFDLVDTGTVIVSVGG